MEQKIEGCCYAIWISKKCEIDEDQWYEIQNDWYLV